MHWAGQNGCVTSISGGAGHGLQGVMRGRRGPVGQGRGGLQQRTGAAHWGEHGSTGGDVCHGAAQHAEGLRIGAEGSSADAWAQGKSARDRNKEDGGEKGRKGGTKVGG